jgi:2-(1,2-epoxy-1,2-dihydrophenyl)acetyl-CoA isomerase
MQDQLTVLHNDKGAVRILRLNRPHRLNALNDAMKKDFTAALAAAEADDAVAAVVLTGEGRAFSAGMDLERFISMYEDGNFATIERVTNLDFPRAIAQFSKPMIAAINGPAVGWGFTMPLLADIRICSTQARFMAGFVRVGVTPEFGSSVLLPRIIGLGRAMELVLTAREVLPGEALSLGLVSQVCEPEELLERACELGETIAAYPRPAVKMAKAILLHGAQNGMEDTLSYEIGCFKRAMATKEHYEAVKAMQAALEKKKAGA